MLIVLCSKVFIDYKKQIFHFKETILIEFSVTGEHLERIYVDFFGSSLISPFDFWF